MHEYWYSLTAAQYNRDLGWSCAPLGQEGAEVTDFRMNGETIPLEKLRIDPPHIRFIVEIPSGITDAFAKISVSGPSPKFNTQIVVALITFVGTLVSAFLLYLSKPSNPVAEIKPGPSIVSGGLPAAASTVASGGAGPAGGSVREKTIDIGSVDTRGAPAQGQTTPGVTGASALVVGSVGWMYVGTRIDGDWGRSKADGREPPKTLQVANLPSAGFTYTVIAPVYVRVSPPKERTDKSRPPMEKSIGALSPGTTIKVDDVKTVQVDDPEPRTWIWAHVTVTALPH